MPAVRRDQWKSVLRYMRPHHLPGLAVGLLGLAVVNAAIGASRPLAPALYNASRATVPAAFAIVAVASLDSSMEVHEHAASRSFRRAQWVHLGAVVAVGAILAALSTASEVSTSDAVASARAMLAYVGLAMICGRMLGWLTCWPLPLAVVIPFSLYSQSGPAGAGPWWAWAVAPPTVLPTWALPAAVLVTGGMAMYITAWRTAMARTAAHAALQWCQRP